MVFSLSIDADSHATDSLRMRNPYRARGGADSAALLSAFSAKIKETPPDFLFIASTDKSDDLTVLIVYVAVAPPPERPCAEH